MNTNRGSFDLVTKLAGDSGTPVTSTRRAWPNDRPIAGHSWNHGRWGRSGRGGKRGLWGRAVGRLGRTGRRWRCLADHGAAAFGAELRLSLVRCPTVRAEARGRLLPALNRHSSPLTVESALLLMVSISASARYPLALTCER